MKFILYFIYKSSHSLAFKGLNIKNIGNINNGQNLFFCQAGGVVINGFWIIKMGRHTGLPLHWFA